MVPGVISGYEDGNFLPKNSITRAESAKMIYSILKNLNEEIISTIKSIDKCKALWYNKKASGASESELDQIWYDSDEQLKANEYYHWNLSGYSQTLHKPFGDYVARQTLIKQEQDSFFGGIVNDGDENAFQYAETDLSWLNNM